MPYTTHLMQSIHYYLQFPETMGTTEMLVELFTPDNTTTVMALCGAQVTSTGARLSYDGSIVPTLQAKVTGSYDVSISATL